MSLRFVIPLVAFLAFANQLHSQQLASWSSFYENGFVWNPALTARWNSWELSATTRKDWIGFDGAPETSTIGFQYPIIKRRNLRGRKRAKTSIGGFFDLDQLGPYQRTGIAGTYAYRIYSLGWFGQRAKRDYFSMGLKVQFNQHRFNNSQLVAFRPDEIDFSILPTSESYRPNVAVGFHYSSQSDQYEDIDHFYFGGSVNNLIPARYDLVVQESIGLRMHAFLHGGFRRYLSRKKYYIEPNAFMSYSYTKQFNLMLSCRYEHVRKWWFSAGLVSNGEYFGQLGLIFDEDSALAPLVVDGGLKLGVKVDYSVGTIRRVAGIGYEFYMAYVFSKEGF